MSSRNRKDVATLFDVFCEVGAGSEGGAAVILQKYPDDFVHEQTLKSVTQFSFPYGLDDDEVEAVQLFAFVLTDEKSQYTYAFCRHTPRNNTCLCILSGLPWASTFYKILNHISAVMNNRSAEELESLLTRAYHTPIPNPGETLLIESRLGVNKLEIIIPDSNRLPTLKEDKYMLEFYNAVSEKQMITLYSSLLKERRILFTGRKLSQLSSCIFAAATLLYPMHWQSLFIPVLPVDLVDMLMAPMPYLIGVPKKTLQAATNLDLGDVVLVDLDERTLQSSHNDVNDLPAEAVGVLRHQLRSSADMFLSDGLARSFLRTNVFLFGGYHSGLYYCASSYAWDGEKFVLSQRPSLQMFLRSLIGQDGVQYLERFIEERLTALNSGTPIDDEFEREVRLMENKRPKSSQLVRENANDMLGALKDKVHSIAIKERLGRLTPKELRRSASKKAVPPANGVPVSFDTQQWTTDESLQVQPQLEAAAMEDVAVVADLIDLGDESTTSVKSGFSHSAPSSAEITPSMTPDFLSNAPFRQLPLQSFDFNQLTMQIPQTQPSSPADVGSLPAAPRSNWERFD